LHRAWREPRNSESPGLCPGLFLCNQTVAVVAAKAGTRRELFEPGDEARVFAPVVSPEAQVAIAEHAGERDLADVRDRSAELWRRGFDRRKRSCHLVGLIFEPFRLVLLCRAPTGLVDRQDRGVEDAVA
jgi:hypothetical protein